MKTDNCGVEDMDWAEVTFDAVLAGAEAGIKDALKELEKRQQLFETDTISAKALGVSEIQIEWIED
jgi:hypothetical protein